MERVKGIEPSFQSPHFSLCWTFRRKRTFRPWIKAIMIFLKSKETILTGCAFYANFMHRTRAQAITGCE